VSGLHNVEIMGKRRIIALVMLSALLFLNSVILWVLQPQTDETKHQLNLTEETGIALGKDATISGFGQFNSKWGSLVIPCKKSGRFIYISLDHEWPEDVIDANNNAEKEKYDLWITIKGKVHQYHAKNGPGTTDPPNLVFQDRGRDDGEYIFENNCWEVPFLILDLTKKKKPQRPNPPQLSPLSDNNG
jgi:hypothetical protein